MSRKLPIAALAALLTLLFAAVLQAGPQDEIKARMKDRLPEIEALKDQGLVGETSDGLLGYVGGQRPREDLVQAENQDRRLVYEAIARQQGATSELVSKRRAQQIAEQAKAGAWLQNESGAWSRKP